MEVSPFWKGILLEGYFDVFLFSCIGKKKSIINPKYFLGPFLSLSSPFEEHHQSWEQLTL